MNTKAIHQVQIDVETKFVKPFMAALGKLKTTVSLENNGEYQYGKGATGYNLLSYTGELNADGIDEWACRVKAGAGYVASVDEKQETETEINVDTSVPDDTAINFQNLAYDAKQADKESAKVYAECVYEGLIKHGKAMNSQKYLSRSKREGGYAGKCATLQPTLKRSYNVRKVHKRQGKDNVWPSNLK